jgi:signal peptidase I
MNEVIVQKLDENIYVYKGLLPNCKNMVDTFVNAESDPESTLLFKDWKPWSRFGTYISTLGGQLLDERKLFEDDPIFIKEDLIIKEIKDAFKYATDQFLLDHGLSVESDWKTMGPSISKYSHKNSNKNESGIKGLEMVYHTDYVTLEEEWPGDKFILTCTMYLNDDYEGGEITFILPNKEILDYKPKAGDVLVFPSGHPELLSDNGKYIHGVKTVKNKDKYLIRTFYQKPFAGSKAWHENCAKYGEDVWRKNEKERVDREFTEYFKNKAKDF